ncbi:protein of unknown function [Taphrina deformans PYCC 5710]|uniref:Ribosomal protein/NADH dehydrogenase domain-containing protein n=1 Tax=Taphrina deformans (strain PYCC 5710 / ATCC 11124 / CBS 356.35 / IMI 108563 / JCM 9778 / NBRC 8474) TaxID=1097556 RepID=R4XE96_TAPDE|nr:protein of unknown function [Taphrina deformans PYCC 5710]|eukprot:CCG84121.1 protein of unknown function [Taphrina deformans PYCC 5710]
MPNRAIVQAKKILDIRVGPGSITLPPEYTALHLSFSQKNANGHMGPRKFTQQNLPRIQYHNPHLSIQVKRINLRDKSNRDVDAVMKLMKSGQTEAQADVLSIRGLHSDEIVSKLTEMTGATKVELPEDGAVAA